jgi:hypothetical protein
VNLGRGVVLFLLLLAPTAWAGPETRGASAIQASGVRQSVEFLSDDRLKGRLGGSEGHREAARWLGAVFKDLGLEPAGDEGTYSQQFRHRGRSGQNVLALLPGQGPGYVVVGAHLDHVGHSLVRGYAKGQELALDVHNGADDNASGIAALIEIARAFKAAGVRPTRSVIFAGFDHEESGEGGSFHFVSSLTGDVSLMINLDMVGRLERDLFVYGATAGEHNDRWLEAANRSVGLPLAKLEVFNERSDSTPFIEGRIPALYFTTGVHPEYHMPGDDAETINVPGVAKIAKLAFGIAARAAMAESNAFQPQRTNADLFPLNTPEDESLTLDGLLKESPWRITFKVGRLTFDLDVPPELISSLIEASGPNGELRVTGKARLHMFPSGSSYRTLTPEKIESAYDDGPVYEPVDLKGTLHGNVLTTDAGDDFRIWRPEGDAIYKGDGNRIRVRGWADGHHMPVITEFAARKADGTPVWVRSQAEATDTARVRGSNSKYESVPRDSLHVGLPSKRPVTAAEGAVGALREIR